MGGPRPAGCRGGVPIARTTQTQSSGPSLNVKLAALGDREAFAGGRFDLVGGDPTGLSAEPTAVWADDLDAVRDHPDRLPGAATAFASAFLAMFICQRPTLLDVLTAVVWGTTTSLSTPRPSKRTRAAAKLGGPPDRRCGTSAPGRGS